MKITRQDECLCRLILDDLEQGDVFRFGAAEYGDDTFMIIRRPKPSYGYVRKYGIPKNFQQLAVLNLGNGQVYDKFRPYVTRHVVKLCAELVVADES